MKILVGIVIGVVLRMAAIGLVDYRYAMRDQQCIEQGKNPVQCNRWENAPLWEKVITYQPNAVCLFIPKEKAARGFYCRDENEAN